jgi:hypothetical protein
MGLGMAPTAEQIALVQLGLKLFQSFRPSFTDLKFLLCRISMVELESCEAAIVAARFTAATQILDRLALDFVCDRPCGLSQAFQTFSLQTPHSLSSYHPPTLKVGFREIERAGARACLVAVQPEKLKLTAIVCAPGRACQAILPRAQISTFAVDNNATRDQSFTFQAVSWSRFRGHSDKIAVPHNPAHRW